jgi:hypothetical protein
MSHVALSLFVGEKRVKHHARIPVYDWQRKIVRVVPCTLERMTDKMEEKPGKRSRWKLRSARSACNGPSNRTLRSFLVRLNPDAAASNRAAFASADSTRSKLRAFTAS